MVGWGMVVGMIEFRSQFPLDFSKLGRLGGCGVIPVVVQDVCTGAVLMLGYVNELALRTAFAENIAVFWSTSRNELWRKGATSGNTMRLREVRINCEQNSVLYLVEPSADGVCHTVNAAGRHRSTCYYRRLRADGQLEQLDP